MSDFKPTDERFPEFQIIAETHPQPEDEVILTDLPSAFLRPGKGMGSSSNAPELGQAVTPVSTDTPRKPMGDPSGELPMGSPAKK